MLPNYTCITSKGVAGRESRTRRRGGGGLARGRESFFDLRITRRREATIGKGFT
jgi:hypothetical protein